MDFTYKWYEILVYVGYKINVGTHIWEQRLPQANVRGLVCSTHDNYEFGNFTI